MELTDINSLSALRKLAKRMDTSEFIEFADKVQTVCTEVKQQQVDEDKKRQQQREKLKSIYELALSEGFNVDENDFNTVMLPTASRKTTQNDKRGKIDPKYAYTDDEGNKNEWSGRGPKPKWLKELISKDHRPEEFLIEKPTQ